MSDASSSHPLRPLLILILILGASALLVLGAIAVGYVRIAAILPPPDELVDRANTFKTTTIYDRESNVIYEVFPADAGRRTLVPLADISPHLINATLAVEDPNFYRHPGVDPVGIARAIYYILRQDAVQPGGSSIVQQLVKLTYLSSERTLERKIKEAVLAIEINRRYPKDTILEIYLNHIFYGNLAYGIETAAQTYFGKPASDLTLAEASLLAGIPQRPGDYDPYTHWNAVRNRQADVLRLMVEHGFITPAEAHRAWMAFADQAPEDVLAQPKANFRYPHFVLMVRQELEATYGPEVVTMGGLRVYTTLDPRLQEAAEQAVREGIQNLAKRQARAGNAALVALDPNAGEVLALVGSADYNNEAIDGQVNMAVVPRQTGSVIKPLDYLATFEMPEDYWTPATIIMDERTEFPDGPGRPPYVPRNYDGKFHGPVSVRSALANSYNIPAVKALQHAGIPALKDLAQRLGISTLTREDYGLSLALGSGEVSLLEMTNAFAAFANGGRRLEPHLILRVETQDGDLLADASQPYQVQAIEPAHAFLITSILSDGAARRPAFGRASRWLELPDRPVAAKTGTTNDVRDGWTIGYTPQIVAGVWVGNTDNAPMKGVSGVSSAAPIWRAFMMAAHEDLPVQQFQRPSDVVQIEICAETGQLATPDCETTRLEYFKSNQLPPEPEG
ncbi:MAG TPA: PBP1A family penicillin-binding protein [Caldilineae bacterium]|nr:PBP1A family penicillin-binding protein [Caldilineae bacterium]